MMECTILSGPVGVGLLRGSGELLDPEVAVCSETRTRQRPPVQARSRASLERMVQAAQGLMIERGKDDFTLNEVASRGGVSIGSIYNRFKSRDELIRAVQALVLADLDAIQGTLIAHVAAEVDSLRMLVMVLIDQMAEAFKEKASILRPIMLRANADPTIATAGKQAYQLLQARVTQELLRYEADIAHSDPVRAAQASFDIVYAALARHLGFGTTHIAAGGAGWTHLKCDLGCMWAAFLLHPRH